MMMNVALNYRTLRSCRFSLCHSKKPPTGQANPDNLSSKPQNFVPSIANEWHVLERSQPKSVLLVRGNLGCGLLNTDFGGFFSDIDGIFQKKMIVLLYRKKINDHYFGMFYQPNFTFVCFSKGLQTCLACF